MSRTRVVLTIILVAAAIGLGAFVGWRRSRPAPGDLWTPAQRFPQPGLPKTHPTPTTEYPLGRATAMEVVDVAVLVVALAAAAYLALRRRSRAGIFALGVVSLAYFGFYREGCVCPIGAIQHVAAALATDYGLPITVLFFFTVPLVFALFFGRVFCSSVCPLGATQELVLLRPMRVPGWLEHALGLLAYVYLGLAVLFAATGAGYVICRYDPFVALFRQTGRTQMLVLAASFVLLSIFVGRPYCRYLCPYGVLLRLLSKLSWRRATITPDECVRCRLCEDACPFGAIRKPTSETGRAEGKTRLGLLILAAPVVVALAGWLGHASSGWFAGAHPVVAQARTVRAELAELEGPEEQLELRTRAFLRTSKTPEQLNREEAGVLEQFEIGGILFGVWVGLVVVGKLVALSVRRTRLDYEAEPGGCVACGRCFLHCPREHLRLDRLRGTRPPEPDPNAEVVETT